MLLTLQRGKLYVYVRVSTNKQDSLKLVSECINYINTNLSEYKEDYTLINIIASSTTSYTFRELHKLEELKNNDILLTTELSRLGRNANETRNIIYSLFNRGVKLIFTRESHNIIADNKLGPLILEVFNLFAEIERERISERTKASLLILKAKGCTLGRPLVKDYLHPKIKANLDEIRTLISNKVSYAAIGRIFGISSQTIIRNINKIIL